MNIWFTFLLSLVFALLSILIFKHDKHKKEILLGALIIFLGCFIRLYQIDKYPVGLNQDEASIGYEAYSLFKYGIDRNGMSIPVHFISWGSGQNAFYAYLIMPFMYFINNNSLLVRLPMSIIGCITLLVIYIFVNKNKFIKNKLLVIFLFAIMPWHIMKSRWGLESNIFPDLIVYGLILFYFGIEKKDKKYLFISSIIFGLSTYAYGTSYFFLPVLLILLYSYYFVKKKINLKDILTMFLIAFLVSLPMIIFVLINYFNLDTVRILKITIPKLYVSRFTSTTSLGNNFFLNCFLNFKNMIKMIFLEQDNMPLNYIKNYGIFYYISLPFLLYGIFIYFKKYRKYDYLNIILIFLVTSIFTGIIVDGNINRLNVIWIPLYVFIILGITDISKRYKYIKIGLIVIYGFSFLGFSYTYFTSYQKEISFINNYGLEESIMASDSDKNVMISDMINQPYIFWLYYKKISPYDYLEGQYIPYKNVMFQQVRSIDNIKFYLPSDNILDSNYNYIIHKKMINNYDTSKCDIINNYEFVFVNCK